MTQGDYLELIVLAGLYGLAFTTPYPRWRILWALHGMSLNMIAGRMLIVYFAGAWALCSAMQLVMAVVFVGMAQSFLGIILGGLYAVMVIGGGLTQLGYLSPSTSIGLDFNYWSVMSIATYLQFVVVLMHIFKQWQYHGLGTRLSGN